MQAKEAMGVESLDKAFLGHGNSVKNVRASINDDDAKAKRAAKDLQGEMDERTASIRKNFRTIDKDFSNKIDEKEILAQMRAWNLETHADDVAALVTALDENSDGSIDFGEFSRGMMRLAQQTHGAVFGLNDRTKPGAMTAKHDLGAATSEPATLEELKAYTNKLSDMVNAKYSVLRKAFRTMDEDKDGKLSRDELVMGVQNFGLPIPLSHIHEIFDHVMDQDENGNVDFNEFCSAMQEYTDKWVEAEKRMKEKKITG
jgi:Ca2+-binding EF-hand superfamily protein